MTLVVDFHALQTVPPSLINRDDTGAPKSAVFGGVPRQRVSSQAWKRAIRRYFEEEIGASTVGLRSRELPQSICAKAMSINPEISAEQAIEGVKALFAKDKIKLVTDKQRGDESEDTEAVRYPTTAALLFLSPSQIERSAQAIVDKLAEGTKVSFSKKEAAELLDTKHSIDMAMFGRMLADAPAYNVDASVQVAHAIGVHESQPEFDYYTAVDDVVEDNEEAGAAMIGTTQMMSSTLYRFATVNVEALAENLQDEELAREATCYFAKAFMESMPTGKQNSFANNTLPELVYVTVRETRSVSLVNAFESPIESHGGNRRAAAAHALANEARDIERLYDLAPKAAFVLSSDALGEEFTELAESVTQPELLSRLAEVLAAEKEQ